jgi:FkbM family methyltransferase
VDAGAYIGDTTAWYLSKYPDATVVGLEPDPDNYSLLLKNCRPYGARAVLLNAGLWHTQTRLTLAASAGHTGISASEAVSTETEAGTEGVTVPYLLNLLRRDEIDILKLDIEGAELQVFGANSDEWLAAVRCIVVEIHGHSEHDAVYRAIGRHSFKSKRYRGTHIFWRR